MAIKNQQWQAKLSNHCGSAPSPLVVILGPTASGKTAFSLTLASFLGNAEIVNADSRQLYRNLDIGTAKITQRQQKGIPHHLLDILDPMQETTAGWYQLEAMRTIDAIHARGNIPVLTGGSMLYISTVTDALSLAPHPDRHLRERLIQEYDIDNGEMLHKRLRECDPESANHIHVHNKPRLIRAVELCEMLQAPRSRSVPDTELRAGDHRCNYDLCIFGMDVPRDILYQHINTRTQAMLESGWIDEVQSLLDAGYSADDPGMKSHGYREIIQFLKEGNRSMKELRTCIAAKTRQYAKRQMTWWRTDPRIFWILPKRSVTPEVVFPDRLDP